MYLKLSSNLWSACFNLPIAGIIGMCQGIAYFFKWNFGSENVRKQVKAQTVEGAANSL
jgi:hypothetical protein